MQEWQGVLMFSRGDLNGYLKTAHFKMDGVYYLFAGRGALALPDAPHVNLFYSQPIKNKDYE